MKKKSKFLNRILTLSTALALAGTVTGSFNSVVNAAEEAKQPQAAVTATNNDAQKAVPATSATDESTNNQDNKQPVVIPEKEGPAAPVNKKVKTFKVSIVKKNYGIFQGNFEKKQSSTKYFHKTFNVNKSFTRNGKKYYWINKKGKPAIGYINKNAVATTSQAKVLKVPYVSQYVPVKTPWGCAGASMSMLLGFQGQKITASFLKKVQNHLPMQPIKGGQKGNVYTGEGFGYVISPGALAKYARTYKTGKNVVNISSKKLTVGDLRMYVQGGKPVLYYGFSSYQKPGDKVRNHCKVITGDKNG